MAMESCWQSKDRAVVGSSIVLLQERFKQLQRLKETRKEKQLLQLMLPHDDDDNGAVKSTSTDLYPSYASSSNHDPLALGLNTNASYDRRIVSRVKTIRDSQYNLIPSVRTNKGSPSFAAKHDVDTSLRL